MDPNANYEEQLRLAQQILGSLETGIMRGTPEFYCSCGRLAELVLALAEWREKGGFLPKALEGGSSREG